MKYAHEVLELFQAYPMRSFRVMEIVRYATRGRYLPAREREAARKAVQRALDALIQNETIQIAVPAAGRGAFAQYSLFHVPLVGHEGEKSGTRSGTIAAG